MPNRFSQETDPNATFLFLFDDNHAPRHFFIAFPNSWDFVSKNNKINSKNCKGKINDFVWRETPLNAHLIDSRLQLICMVSRIPPKQAKKNLAFQPKSRLGLSCIHPYLWPQNTATKEKAYSFPLEKRKTRCRRCTLIGMTQYWITHTQLLSLFYTSMLPPPPPFPPSSLGCVLSDPSRFCLLLRYSLYKASI